MRGLLRESAAFLLIGGFGFALYTGISVGLATGGMNSAIAAFSGHCLSIPPIYLLQRRVTFRSSTPLSRSVVRYAALQVVNAVVAGAGTEALGFFDIGTTARVMLAGAIGVLISFGMQKRFVFDANQ